ncbi:hypothetical protein E1B28_011364 [Marasmius oreades]|uniref:Uncharacterized protein n=1 Tax=Marasmius oreades TaxID=181124 RepID=A0A9P7RTX8_9AGAR|nr:uncharacterized protein E1B28_011364 [Marasmius oreades]KAG7089709.1 hypothetical protein E1B28_011364 [Marasmius oreades]
MDSGGEDGPSPVADPAGPHTTTPDVSTCMVQPAVPKPPHVAAPGAPGRIYPGPSTCSPSPPHFLQLEKGKGRAAALNGDLPVILAGGRNLQ